MWIHGTVPWVDSIHMDLSNKPDFGWLPRILVSAFQLQLVDTATERLGVRSKDGGTPELQLDVFGVGQSVTDGTIASALFLELEFI